MLSALAECQLSFKKKFTFTRLKIIFWENINHIYIRKLEVKFFELLLLEAKPQCFTFYGLKVDSHRMCGPTEFNKNENVS